MRGGRRGNGRTAGASEADGVRYDPGLFLLSTHAGRSICREAAFPVNKTLIIKLIDLINLHISKKAEPHRTQILWGVRQGSYPLSLYEWHSIRIRERKKRLEEAKQNGKTGDKPIDSGDNSGPGGGR